jgi:hypothetical protein
MLQEITGHASISTTLGLYGHIYPVDLDRYADRLANAADAAGTEPESGQLTTVTAAILGSASGSAPLSCW